MDAVLEREFTYRPQDIKFIAGLVHSRTGIVLTERKRDMIYTRLARRLRSLKLNSFQDYCELLSRPEGQEEIGQLVNAITTNMTSFFREPYHFDYLKEVLTSRPASEKRLRIWSAGCSSGVESYSIAMVMMDSLPHIDRMDARILATDIDTNMLQTGANGVYPLDTAEKIPPVYRSQYTLLRKAQGEVVMANSLKKLIAFKPLNLLESWPMKGPFDIIFCRNVVIYFDKDTQRKLFQRFANMLHSDGLLFIGHSETLHNISYQFELCSKTTYRKVA